MWSIIYDSNRKFIIILLNVIKLLFAKKLLKKTPHRYVKYDVERNIFLPSSPLKPLLINLNFPLTLKFKVPAFWLKNFCSN